VIVYAMITLLLELRLATFGGGSLAIVPISMYKLDDQPGGDANHGAVVSERTSRSGIDIILVHLYIGIMKGQPEDPIVVERVQTGVRMEKRLLKILKGLAELKDMTLGDLLEGIVLHAFEGKTPFSPDTLKEIEKLRSIYGLTLKAADSHQLKEKRK